MQREIIQNEHTEEELVDMIDKIIHFERPHKATDIFKIFAGIILIVIVIIFRKQYFIIVPIAICALLLLFLGVHSLIKKKTSLDHYLDNSSGHDVFIFAGTLLLNILYIPLLSYFFQLAYVTTTQCPAGYYWGSFIGDTVIQKTTAHCIPCSYTLKQKYPGIEGYLNDLVYPDLSSFIKYKFKRFVSNNPEIYYDTFNGTNNTDYEYSYAMCPQLCSGHPVRIIKYEPSLYFDYDILPKDVLLFLWGIVFVMIGCPVLFFVLVYRARSEFKTILAYGETKENRWHSLMLRISSTGSKFCKDYNYFNPYFEIVKIIYKFFVLLVTSFANYASSYIIVCLPVLHLLMFILTFFRKPYLSFLNNVVDCILYAINTIVGIITFVNIIKPLPDKVNSWTIIISDAAGILATIVTIIGGLLFKNEPNDPTRFTELDLRRFKEEEKARKKKQKEKHSYSYTYSEESYDEQMEEDDNKDTKTPNENAQKEELIEIPKELIQPVDGSHEVLDKDINQDRIYTCRRFNTFYMIYDFLVKDAEYSILLRYARLMGIMGLVASFPGVIMKHIRRSCIDYKKWF